MDSLTGTSLWNLWLFPQHELLGTKCCISYRRWSGKWEPKRHVQIVHFFWNVLMNVSPENLFQLTYPFGSLWDKVSLNSLSALGGSSSPFITDVVTPLFQLMIQFLSHIIFLWYLHGFFGTFDCFIYVYANSFITTNYL